MAPDSQNNPPVVFVISPDWALRAMVRAELREANIEALGTESVRDMANSMAQGVAPSLIVVDGVELKDATAQRVLKDLARTVLILIVDSRTDSAPDLPGTEILWRPLRVQDIVSRALEKLGREEF